jgi:hypothetical protein
MEPSLHEFREPKGQTMSDGHKEEWNDEIKKQLERVRASKTFEGHPKVGELLIEFVEAEIKNEKPEEHELGQKLFNKPKDWIPLNESAVRERKRSLRKALVAYYNTEGREDPIIFELPKYNRLKILPNPRADAAQKVQLALKLRAETFPDVSERYAWKIVGILEECIDLHANYAPAYLAYAETLLMYAACDCKELFPAGETIIRAENATARALALERYSWHAHVLSGTLRCCRFDWTGAGEAFDKSLELNACETRAHLFYVIYLCAVGRIQDASECVEHWRIEGGERYQALVFALLSYLESNIPIAFAFLKTFSVSGSQIDFDPEYQEGNKILKFDFLGAYLLCACIFLHRGENLLARKYAETGIAESNVGAFYGLLVLAYGRCGKNDSQSFEKAEEFLALAEGILPRRPFSLPSDPNPVSAFSLGVAYLAVGRKKEAIEMLSKSCDEGFPLAMLLHRLPLFYDLRSEVEFNKLITRISPSH